MCPSVSNACSSPFSWNKSFHDGLVFYSGNERGKINAHLEKFAPIPQEAKPVFEDDIPVRERHFQVERFLTGVLSIVECELVKVLEFGTVSDFPLQTRQLLLKFVQRITAAN